MAHARRQHPNARLTPRHRLNMVECVLEQGWSIEATADRFQVDAKTVRKWRDRYLAEGQDGLADRSSRPHRSPNQTPPGQRRQVVRLRCKHRWGADHITHEVGLATSTVQQGEHTVKRKARYRYIHSAIDDRTRLVYSEIHNDETAVTAAGFWRRTMAFYAGAGIVYERVLTDNGSCYKSGLWHRTCAETGTKVKKGRPRRPQTNGKIERFHRILLEEWAYIRPWTSDPEGHRAYAKLIHFYNHHRSHGAPNWATPAASQITQPD